MPTHTARNLAPVTPKGEERTGWNESRKEDPKNPLAGRIQDAAERKHEVRNFYRQGDGTCRDATLPSARMGVLSRSGSSIRLTDMSMSVWPMVGAYACA